MLDEKETKKQPRSQCPLDWRPDDVKQTHTSINELDQLKSQLSDKEAIEPKVNESNESTAFSLTQPMIDRFSSYDTGPYKSRLRTIFSRSQVDEMTRVFIHHRYISNDETIRLSRRIGLQPRQVCLI